MAELGYSTAGAGVAGATYFGNLAAVLGNSLRYCWAWSK